MEVSALTPSDLERFPIWQYGTDQEHLGSSESEIRPVTHLPARHLVERFVGTQVRLAGGRLIWAILADIDLHDAAYTDAALHITLFTENGWLPITRFGQDIFDGLNPDHAAKRIRIPQDALFPIYYDVSAICEGEQTVLQRSIGANVKGPVTMQDRSAMILRNVRFQRKT